jgi:2-iminobutanoate/2-iminopropanoate deaminase
MSKNIVFSQNAPEPIGPYSQAVEMGGLLFVSGQIAIDAASGNLLTQDIGTETKMVMENMGSILKEGGYSFENILKCSIFLSDMTLFAEMNRVYGEYFSQSPPARETIAVLGLPKGVNVEISCIAMK